MFETALGFVLDFPQPANLILAYHMEFHFHTYK